MGIGGASLAGLRDVPAADAAWLDIREVDAAFDQLAASSGAGSASRRAEILRQLFGRATRDEQDFLLRLLFGELRQGALEGVLMDAVSKASGIAATRVRRAAMLAGDLAPVARTALVEGEDALSRFVLQPFQPLQPMLADSADDVGGALAALGEASFEYKLDGARIQVHKVGDEVKVYSRNLRDVTVAVPEVVTVARAMPAHALVLDGEVIALRENGMPQPFQITMKRFGRKLDIDRLKAELPLTPFFFDALYVDGAPLVDQPLTRRIEVLGEQVGAGNLVPRLVTADVEAAASFTARALATGHEGVMAKALASPYRPGRRSPAWRKIKPRQAGARRHPAF
jgi:DNA ligase-1